MLLEGADSAYPENNTLNSSLVTAFHTLGVFLTTKTSVPSGPADF